MIHTEGVTTFCSYEQNFGRTAGRMRSFATRISVRTLLSPANQSFCLHPFWTSMTHVEWYHMITIWVVICHMVSHHDTQYYRVYILTRPHSAPRKGRTKGRSSFRMYSNGRSYGGSYELLFVVWVVVVVVPIWIHLTIIQRLYVHCGSVGANVRQSRHTTSSVMRLPGFFQVWFVWEQEVITSWYCIISSWH